MVDIIFPDGTTLATVMANLNVFASNPGTSEGEGEIIYNSTDNKTYVNIGTAETPNWSDISGSSGVTDHGVLTGLADDDHTQYLLADGTRAMTGDLDLGENYLKNGKIWTDLYDSEFQPNLVLPGFGDTLYYSVERGATVSANVGPDAGVLSYLFNLDNGDKATWHNVSTSNPILTINWGTDRYINTISIIHAWRDSQLTNAVIEVYEDNDDNSVYQWTTLETITGNTDYIVMVSCNLWRVQQIRITVTSAGSGDQANKWSVGTIQAPSAVNGLGTGHMACLGANTFYGDQEIAGNLNMGTNNISNIGALAFGAAPILTTTDAGTFTFKALTTTILNFTKTLITFAKELAMSGNKITGLGTPTANTDATTKGYADSLSGTDSTSFTLDQDGAGASTVLNFNTGGTSALSQLDGTVTLDIPEFDRFYIDINGASEYYFNEDELVMYSNKITGLGAGTSNGDAICYEQLIGQYLLLSGGTLSGTLNFNSNNATSVGNIGFGAAPIITTTDAGEILFKALTTSMFGMTKTLNTNYVPLDMDDNKIYFYKGASDAASAYIYADTNHDLVLHTPTSGKIKLEVGA